MSEDRRIQKLPTGIEGFDTILHGGVLRGGIYIILGTPGAGKTILGNQLCFNHAAAGGRALYVTLLAETHGRMLGHIGQLAFFDEALIPDGVSYLSAFRILETEGLKGLADALRREIRARKVDLLVLDGLVSAEESAGTPREFKKFIHELQIQADLADCTMMLLTSAAADPSFASAEHTMVDGLIELQTRMRGRRSERDLVVHKLRGSGFIRGVHSFAVTDEGITVQPRIEAVLSEPSKPIVIDGPKISTGVAMFDEIMGGGPYRRSATLVMGAAGTGKTTAGLHFLGAGKDERGIFVSFDEAPAAIRLKAKSLDLPVGRMFEEGLVEFMWRPSTEAVFDEVFGALLERVRAGKVQRIFIDGINDFAQMTGEEARMTQALTALTNECRTLGATTMVSLELAFNGVVPGQPLAGLPVLGLSPVAENIVLMRLAVLGADVHRLIITLKARDSAFALKFRRYDLTARGLEIEPDSVQADIVLSQLVQPTGVAPAPFGAIAPRLPGDAA